MNSVMKMLVYQFTTEDPEVEGDVERTALSVCSRLKLHKRNGTERYSGLKFDIHAALDNALIEPLRRGSPAKSDGQRRQNRPVCTPSPPVAVVVQGNFCERTELRLTAKTITASKFKTEFS